MNEEKYLIKLLLTVILLFNRIKDIVNKNILTIVIN